MTPHISNSQQLESLLTSVSEGGTQAENSIQIDLYTIARQVYKLCYFSESPGALKVIQPDIDAT